MSGLEEGIWEARGQCRSPGPQGPALPLSPRAASRVSNPCPALGSLVYKVKADPLGWSAGLNTPVGGPGTEFDTEKGLKMCWIISSLWNSGFP